MSENERLREALKSYGRHKAGCPYDAPVIVAITSMGEKMPECTCGLSDALAAKPDVCVYTRELFENEVRLTSACGRVWTWKDVDAGMAIPDEIHQYCSKCGAKIEVRE